MVIVKKELITVNNISDILEANESLENCQALCNRSIKSPELLVQQRKEQLMNIVEYATLWSYSNSLNICNMYQDERRAGSSGGENLNTLTGSNCNNDVDRNENENFTTYKRNAIALNLNNQTPELN